MARHSSLRTSDADRDAVAERLREAAIEGRLEPHELEERLHRALRARTYGELDRLVGDLPRRSVTRQRRPVVPIAGMLLVATVRLFVALLVVAALVTALAVTAAWWLIGVLIVWLSMRSRRSCASFHRPPRARRVYY
jgi:small-conductance mechanosensitive channel